MGETDNLIPESEVEVSEIKEVSFGKRDVKKQVNFTLLALLLYTVILYGAVIIDIFINVIIISVRCGSDDAAYNAQIEEYMKVAETNATSMIVGVLLGVAFLCIFFKKRTSIKRLFMGTKKMPLKRFAALLCVFMGAQFVSVIVDMGLEWVFNQFGYSISYSAETASATSTTVSMFIYVSLVAPIFEEIVYRGFVLRSLQRFGKGFAIVMSAVLFGTMHANIPQGIYATLVGIVLGYVAIEYSMGWAIALHMINNCLFGDVLGTLITYLSEDVANTITAILVIGLFVIGVIICIVKRKAIINYFRRNRAEKGFYRYAFTAIFTIIFILINVLMAFSMVQKI